MKTEMVGNWISYVFDHLPRPGNCAKCGYPRTRDSLGVVRCPECRRKYSNERRLKDPERFREIDRRSQARQSPEQKRDRYKRNSERKHYLYGTWTAMNSRCDNPNNMDYDLYGGSGVIVHEDWKRVNYQRGTSDPRVTRTTNRARFSNFVKYMEEKFGARPDGWSIDRYPDMRGNYEPGNVRWASQFDQVKNTRTYIGNRQSISENESAVDKGKSISLLELSKISGIPLEVIKQRWAISPKVDDILNINKKTSRIYEYEGNLYSLMDLTYITGLKPSTVKGRIERGWSVDKIVRTPLVINPTRHQVGED